jgi:hypothetical protein
MCVRGSVPQSRHVIACVKVGVLAKGELVHRYDAAHGVHQRGVDALRLVCMAVGSATGLRNDREIAGRESHARVGELLIQRPWIAEMAGGTADRCGVMGGNESGHLPVARQAPFALAANQRDAGFHELPGGRDVSPGREKVSLAGQNRAGGPPSPAIAAQGDSDQG